MKHHNKMCIYICIILITIVTIKGDLPVNCKAEDVFGTWKFYIEAFSFVPSLSNIKTTCGHGFPNTISKVIGDIDYNYFKSNTSITITLGSDFNVYENTFKVGYWTQIYNQAFLIKYKDVILTASFKYYLDTNDKVTYVSNCGKTMIGWYNEGEMWSCMYGMRINNENSYLSFIQVKNKNILNDSNNNNLKYYLFNNLQYNEMANLVKEINDNNLIWKATLYDQYKDKPLNYMLKQQGLLNKKIFTFHKTNYSPFIISLLQKKTFHTNNKRKLEFLRKELQKPSERFNTTSNNSNNKGTHRTHKLKSNNVIHDIDSQYVTNYNEVIKYIKTPLNEINENTLPLNWDWRNVGGISYVPEPLSQGDCGSCYTFSTIQSLESRLRIKTNNKDHTQFSIQFPLSCNFYSEGCDGGYPILVAKFLSEFELVPKKCFEYTATNNKCSNVCDNYQLYPLRYKVSEYGYLGGFYGATNEILMMKEIRARGPIPGNMKVPFSFNFYKEGIFSTNELKYNSKSLSKVRLVDMNLSFESVDHSVVLVGYGEENGVKYWIGMNTWGKEWGEGGYFKIIRGENEQSIETMGDYFNIEVDDRETGELID